MSAAPPPPTRGLGLPTGFVRLADGRFVVAEEERGRVRIVEELK